MDRRRVLLLIAALAVATGAALGARSLFVAAGAPGGGPAQPQAMGQKVLVAQRALPAGTILTADAVTFQPWPIDRVHDAYFAAGEVDPGKLLGTVVRLPIAAGQPLTQGALVAPGDRGFLAAALAPGMRAVTIAVSAKTGVGGFVFPGDHVDLMLTQSVDGAGGPALKATETFLRNLRVLATDQSTQSETADGKTLAHTSSTVTLEVTPRMAEKLAVAETIGTLSLALRSLGDSPADLDRAVASGAVQLPEHASLAEEDRLLAKALREPQEGATTYVTGGDVSRFQRRSPPPLSLPAAPAPPPIAMAAPPPGARYAAPRGPIVRVTRGKSTEDVEVAGR